MCIYLFLGTRRIHFVEVTLDQVEIKQDGENHQTPAKHGHFAVGSTGGEEQANETKDGDPGTHEEIPHPTLHSYLSRSSASLVWRHGVGIDTDQRIVNSTAYMGPMMTDLHWLASICSAGVTIHGSLLAGLFLAGAAGSVVHCAPMCGVFVMGQVSDRIARLDSLRMCESARIRNGMLFPYHLGRITTYAALGAVAAGSTSALQSAGWFNPASATLLLLAAVLFLTHALGRTRGGFGRAPAWWGRTVGRATRRIPRRTWVGEAMFGLALGFLPCGFLYAAVAAAAATGRPWMGAAAMISFGAGTAPSLMVVGIAGQAAGRRWGRIVTAAAPAVMALNAALLLVLAWQRMT